MRIQLYEATRPRLPPDILLYLVNCIDKSLPAGQEVLKALSLTAPIFVAPCQAKLFSDIILNDTTPACKPGETPGKKLLQLLEPSPHISRYISGLIIAETWSPSRQGTPWFSKKVALPDAVRRLKLPLLKRLVIYCGFGSEPTEEVREAFYILCEEAINLVTLRLDRVPMSLLEVCGSDKIKALSPSNLMTEGAYDLPPTSVFPARPATKLASLEFSEDYYFEASVDCLLDERNGFNLEELKDLQTGGEIICYPDVVRLLERCKALERLRFDLGWDEDPGESLSLTRLPCACGSVHSFSEANPQLCEIARCLTSSPSTGGILD